MKPKSETTQNPLSDVAILPPEKNLELTLDEVGVENVQAQIRTNGYMLPTKANASVSLTDRRSRGIHMSRLFQILMRLQENELSWDWMTESLNQMLRSHDTLSDSAHMQLTFDLPVPREGLLSGQMGWRNYPVTYAVSSQKGKLSRKLSVRVLYSSTCPCSASLSRQAIQERFIKEFAGQTPKPEAIAEWLRLESSTVATPHSQRSEAFCQFEVEPNGPSALDLIDAVESALGTPVQTAVKREDEQEFARLNAQNLMFCEDAARKLKWAFLDRKDVTDFAIEVRHFESLHPHDVVAKVRKFD